MPAKNKSQQQLIIESKALSRSQQRFFGMIRSIQKGKLDAPSKEMAETAKKMKKKDVLEFASTKHDKPKKLPEKVKPKKDKKKKKKSNKKSSLIAQLTKLANDLDDDLFYEEANLIDKYIKKLLSSS